MTDFEDSYWKGKVIYSDYEGEIQEHASLIRATRIQAYNLFGEEIEHLGECQTVHQISLERICAGDQAIIDAREPQIAEVRQLRLVREEEK